MLDEQKMLERAEKVRAAQAKRGELVRSNGDLRDDIHRRGVFMPERYTFVGWYWLGRWARLDGEKATVMQVSETLEKFFRSEDAADFRSLTYGDFGQCGVCGAHFMMGEVWQHIDTLDMVHIGHDCVAKYGMAGVNWDAIEDERRRYLEGRKTAVAREKARAEMFALYPGLEAAFAENHYIIKDIRARFERYGAISEKQIMLVLKIAREEQERSAKKAVYAAEAHVPAPTGCVTVRGVVVTKKSHLTQYGATWKMTVKVETPAGSWLCWGTVPKAISDVERGQRVEFQARLEAGREPHFALFKRPTQARILEAAEAA